jgi:hypothetical protein
VIRIRYSNELRPGLHGRVERRSRDTFIYLMPGLTPQQRQAAMRRLRQQGKMGISSRLPLFQLVPALLADRLRTVFGQAGTIVRVHPAGSTLPVMAVSVAIASFLVLSALSVHIEHLPPQAEGGAVGTRVPTGASVEPLPSPTGPHPTTQPTVGGQPGGQSGGQSGGEPGGQSGGQPGGTPTTGTSSITSPSPGASGPSSSPSPGGGTLTSTSATAPPSQDPTPPTSPSAAPSPSPSPSPTPTSHSGQACVDIGSLGICLGL